MRSASTPRLDAFLAWRDAGFVGDVDWPAPPPPPWSDEAERLTAVIDRCASGVAAAEVRAIVTDTRDGRRLPTPPTQRKGYHR